jgi:hypothetical protein
MIETASSAKSRATPTLCQVKKKRKSPRAKEIRRNPSPKLRAKPRLNPKGARVKIREAAARVAMAARVGLNLFATFIINQMVVRRGKIATSNIGLFLLLRRSFSLCRHVQVLLEEKALGEDAVAKEVAAAEKVEKAAAVAAKVVATAPIRRLVATRGNGALITSRLRAALTGTNVNFPTSIFPRSTLSRRLSLPSAADGT